MPMTASVAAWVLRQGGAWALVLARVSGLAATAPAWGTPGLGWRVRLGLVVLLTAALIPAVGPTLAVALAGVALGLLGRAAPTLQLMALALPVRWAVGLVLVLLGLAGLAATMATAWGDLPAFGGGSP